MKKFKARLKQRFVKWLLKEQRLSVSIHENNMTGCSNNQFVIETTGHIYIDDKVLTQCEGQFTIVLKQNSKP